MHDAKILLTTAIGIPLGLMGAMALNTRFRGRSLVRSGVPRSLRDAVVRHRHGMAIHLLPSGAANTVLGTFRHRRRPMVDRQQLVLVIGHRRHLGVLALHLHDGDGRPAEHLERTVRGGRHGRDHLDTEDPLRRPPPDPRALLLGLLLSTLAHFNNFALPYVLLGTPAPEAALTLPVNVYQTSFQVFRFGLGAAMAVISLILMIIPAVFYLRASKLTVAVGEDEPWPPSPFVTRSGFSRMAAGPDHRHPPALPAARRLYGDHLVEPGPRGGGRHAMAVDIRVPQLHRRLVDGPLAAGLLNSFIAAFSAA